MYQRRPDRQLVLGVAPTERDAEGFLRNLEDWSPTLAKAIALEDGIVLTADHWVVINAVRQYYQQYRISPAARIIVGLLKGALGPEKASSIHLMQLFTGRPARMVNKVAGLPKPTNCD